MKIVRPPAPPERRSVRVVSLSAPVPALCPRRFDRACRNLEALGYQVTLGRHARAQSHFMAGSPRERADDLVDAWFDPSVDVVLSSIGGTCTHQVLEYLPFERMAAQPKVLVGYSDTTTLMLALYARTGLVSFHGPALMPQFGEHDGLHAASRESFERSIGRREWSGELPELGVLIEEHLRWETEDDRPRQAVRRSTRRCLREGHASGRIVVANMGCLLLLAGTPYFPDLENAILVIEDDETESPETIDRYLTHMRHLGVWERVRGLVVGRFPSSVSLSDEMLDEMLERATSGRDIPIMTGFEVGHVDPILTVPIGVMGELDTSERSLRMTERPTI